MVSSEQREVKMPLRIHTITRFRIGIPFIDGSSNASDFRFQIFNLET